jgi:glycerophosphoryl diester phosphodiesterase
LSPFGERVPPALRGGPLLIAHRGGSALAPENTMAAFRAAVERWDSDMIELDVHASADGRCMVIHDPTVDRTTDGTGAVAGLKHAELAELDAGHRFTTDGGLTFPLRGQGIGIPTLDEVLDALPDTRFTVEVKDGRAQAPMFDSLRERGAEHRVVIAGMRVRDRTLFHRWSGAISGAVPEVRRFYILFRCGLGAVAPIRSDVVQVPEYQGRVRLVTPAFIRTLARRNVPVHVWTVNEADDMRRLLDWGVDGIVTDRPDRLAELLTERGHRPRVE